MSFFFLLVYQYQYQNVENIHTLEIRHQYYVVNILPYIGRRQAVKSDILSSARVDLKELVLIQIYYLDKLMPMT